MENAVLFLGRLHPLAVHLPIGILLLLLGLELAALFPRAPQLPAAVRNLILFLAALAASVSVLFGWLLARDGGYDADLLARHRYLGLATAGLAWILVLARRRSWRLYAPLLVVTLLTLVAAGHFGGSLTHGADYLSFAPPAKKTVPAADPARPEAFAAVIQPILEQRCVSCHGPTKSNGGLRLDTWAALQQGGKHGKVFKAGDTAVSAMIQRAHLPLEEKKHMPPRGKPQLTDDELALLEWWIEAGAPRENLVTSLALPPAIRDILAVRFPVLRPVLPDRAAMLATAAALEQKTGVLIRPLTSDGPWLAANARFLGARFGDAQLAELASLAPALQSVDLGETAVTDSGLALLAKMENLHRVYLDKTGITDAGLAHLAGLGQLEYLNLHTTAITDTGVAALRPLTRLRALYLWQTKVTPAAARALGDQLVDHRRIDRWRDQVADLQGRIRAEEFTANLGAPALPPVSPPAAPATAVVPPVVQPK